jgi:ribonucleoside-diphosphate reductase alpha chain
MKKRPMPQRVQKRDGSVVKFDPEKIRHAIFRAAFEVLQDKAKASPIAERLTGIVSRKLAVAYKGKLLQVETIQDTVEAVLMSEGYSRIARSYILYRERRSDLRLAKSVLGIKDDLKLPLNTMEVLKKRYLLRDDQQNIMKLQRPFPQGCFTSPAKRISALPILKRSRKIYRSCAI